MNVEKEEKTISHSKTGIQDIFKNQIKIEPKVMAIQTMFNNPRRLSKTNYAPPYQRNYVWDNEKATYFLESIILGTEIPPLIFFRSGESIEVIDGRQRYETIFNFVRENSKQKLTQKGLLIFNDLKNKKFDDLNIAIKDAFWQTKLRSIEFSFINDNENKAIEEIVKREVFKRYNSGITPLKTNEIDKAKYLESNLNSYFKKKITSDRKTYDIIKTLFHYDNINIEIILKEIRKLLVLDKIPISYYTTQKDIVLNKFYEFYFEKEDIDVEAIYVNFIQKVNILFVIYNLLDKSIINRLIFECLFWAISVAESEGVDLAEINKTVLKNDKDSLHSFVLKNSNAFSVERNSFAPQIMKRFNTTANYFEKKYLIDYSKYLKNHDEFKTQNSEIDKKGKTDKSTLEKFESLRLNKPDASSITIDDICRQMENSRFLIRPPYQRDEVINRIKSSSIIESIILGIKLPPIFIYKRKDGISEVIDGQQRLLSIIGFIGKKYIDEKNKLVESKKNNFTLSLKNGILSTLDRNSYKDLTTQLQNKILDFDLWVIEIDERNNPDFEPVDLYLRLNSKPFAIKENTFEMWNSYVDSTIISKIKIVSHKYSEWFYLRKNNSRMDNEDLIANLIYLFYKSRLVEKDFQSINTFLDFYLTNEKISVRIKAKNDVSNVLENEDNRERIITEIESFSNNFLDILIRILGGKKQSLGNELDKLLNAETKRTSKNFYIIWVLLFNADHEKINNSIPQVRKSISSIIQKTNKVKSKEAFEKEINEFWNKYNV